MWRRVLEYYDSHTLSDHHDAVVRSVAAPDNVGACKRNAFLLLDLLIVSDYSPNNRLAPSSRWTRDFFFRLLAGI